MDRLPAGALSAGGTVAARTGPEPISVAPRTAGATARPTDVGASEVSFSQVDSHRVNLGGTVRTDKTADGKIYT